MKRWIPVALLLTNLMVVSPSQAQQRYSTVTAHSGRAVKVMQMGPMIFADGKNKALMLQYLSEVNIDDKPNLAKEIAEIWPSFRFDVEKGGYSGAIISANEIAKPGLLGFTNNRGCNFVFEKDPNGAWRCLNDAAIVKPDVLYKRTMSLLQSNKYEPAITSLNELIGLWPNSAECYLNRSACYLSLHDWKKALSDCNKAISINPNVSMAYVNRGVAYNKLGDQSHAIEDCNKALTINPDSDLAHLNRGEYMLKADKLENAVKDLTAAISKNPSVGEAYFYRAEAYRKLGNSAAAQKDSAQAKILKYHEGSDTMLVK
ncbi:MAG: tetratricopeptide repeat protein [Cyanobacteria bacterium SZAS LIN-3]|nr:tetratricopeptide repeat protein [Cyanobacteria bacterium SZAS LIN-3]